jgi:hypothetical protein
MTPDINPHGICSTKKLSKIDKIKLPLLSYFCYVINIKPCYLKLYEKFEEMGNQRL